MYNDEVVQFSGGIYEYVGKIKKLEKRGKGWYRIKNPCMVIVQDNPMTKSRVNILAEIAGPQKNFKKFVDVYIPPESIIEIKVLDLDGQMYKLYEQETTRKYPKNIILPDMGIAAPNIN